MSKENDAQQPNTPTPHPSQSHSQLLAEVGLLKTSTQRLGNNISRLHANAIALRDAFIVLEEMEKQVEEIEKRNQTQSPRP